MIDPNLISDAKLTTANKQMLKQWLIVHILGFIILNLLGTYSQRIQFANIGDKSVFFFIWFPTLIGGISHLIIGLLQYYVLRRYYPTKIKGNWVQTPIITGIIGFVLYAFIRALIIRGIYFPEIAFSILGNVYLWISLGLVQYYYLRTSFSKSHWWAITSTLAFLI